eukprot:TRINITY_DN19787_c0_g1_i1.p1 TRINITY_DN19787_c0_g1~~TRINITY_DN19787_c0_g1_i1.p1  ORF type:complete len:164 (-),score=33.66 TRINITY_DN19787_c0_g1_i1:10-501(-)
MSGEEDEETYLKKNFSWIVENKIAGSSCPGNGQRSILPIDLKWLQSKNVTGIVSLNEAGLDSSVLKGFGMEHLVLPVADHYGPTIEQLEEMVRFVDRQNAALVHCNAGQGRTGTVLAAYLIAKEGFTASEAIKKLQSQRKGSCGTNHQRNSLLQWEQHLNNKK